MCEVQCNITSSYVFFLTCAMVWLVDDLDSHLEFSRIGRFQVTRDPKRIQNSHFIRILHPNRQFLFSFMWNPCAQSGHTKRSTNIWSPLVSSTFRSVALGRICRKPAHSFVLSFLFIRALSDHPINKTMCDKINETNESQKWWKKNKNEAVPMHTQTLYAESNSRLASSHWFAFCTMHLHRRGAGDTKWRKFGP